MCRKNRAPTVRPERRSRARTATGVEGRQRYGETERDGRDACKLEADAHDARARIVRFTDTGLAWLEAFRTSVAQAQAELRAEVGEEVATVVTLGLEIYGAGDGQ